MSLTLKQQQERFQARQRELQARITQDAASRPAQPARTAAAATTSEAKKPEVPVHWSKLATYDPSGRALFRNPDGTRTLEQQVQQMRKAPIGAQIKAVLKILLEVRKPLLPEEIKVQCGVDVTEKELLEALKNNIKVSYDGTAFSYKSKFTVANKEEVLRLIRKAPEGINMNDLKDAYPDIIKDCEDFKAAGQAWILTNSDTQEDIIYPNDPRAVISCDDDVKELIRSVELPREFVDIERELQKAGMRPFTNYQQRMEASASFRLQQMREREAKKKSKRREGKRTKFTNTHLPELFNGSIPGPS